MDRRLKLTGQREAVAYHWYTQGWSDRRIADEVALHQQTIADWRHRRGLPTTYHYTPARIIHSQAMRLYRAGQSDRAIAKTFAVSAHAVWRWRNRRGLESNRGPGVEPDMERRTLILALRERGRPVKEIAKQVGYHWGTVYRLIHELAPAMRRPNEVD